MRKIFIILIMFISLGLGIYGIQWGLPSESGDFNTYHPDECATLLAISNMKPSSFNFNPHSFAWGTFYFYIVAIVLKIGAIFKLFALSADKYFYIHHLVDLSRMYLIGRLVTLAMGVTGVYLVYIIGKKLYNEQVGLWSALFMAVLPEYVINSHFMVPDIPATFWFLLSFVFAIQILNRNETKWYILAGFAAGFAAATKYHAGLICLTIIAAHMLKVRRVEIFNRKLILSGLCMVISFFIGCPYSVLAFGEFRDTLFGNWHGLALHGHVGSINTGGGCIDYLYRLLPFGMGWPLLISSVGGIFFAILKRTKEDFLLLSAGLPLFLVLGLIIKTRMLHYTLPFIPFFVILGTRLIFYEGLWNWLNYRKVITLITAIVVFSYTILYTLSICNLMVQKDVRTEASEWIEQNISFGSKIGVARHRYFWTPPSIQEFQSKYAVVDVNYDVFKLEEEKPSYFVISSFEYRDYLRLKEITPVQYNFLQKLMSGQQFKMVKCFQKFPQIFGLIMEKREPPWDRMYIYPTILIFKMT